MALALALRVQHSRDCAFSGHIRLLRVPTIVTIVPVACRYHYNKPTYLLESLAGRRNSHACSLLASWDVLESLCLWCPCAVADACFGDFSLK
eukprot:m.126639 g.126639  ORF g.126639 m.126639 type:complete len:92 (+) comp17381_c0_seq8:1216-1491(+)